MANSYMVGRPPTAQNQNGQELDAPKNQELVIFEACPGKCGFAKTFTHPTHCCTGCSRDEEHTNNCERKPFGHKDGSPIKLLAVCCECLV